MAVRLQWALVLLSFLLSIAPFARAFSEPGSRTFHVDNHNNMALFAKSLYNNSQVHLRITCRGVGADAEAAAPHIRVSWVLRHSPCAEEYAGLTAKSARALTYHRNPHYQQIQEFTYGNVQFKNSSADSNRATYLCDGSTILLNEERLGRVIVKPVKKFTNTLAPTSSSAAPNTSAGRRRLLAWTPGQKRQLNASMLPSEAAAGLVSSAWRDGIYLFVVQLTCVPPSGSTKCEFAADVSIEMRGDYGWLSAIEWPLLPFYGVMCLLYLFYGLLWLLFCARHWRDLLRIQFCIAGVIFLGMLEKAVFYAEYQSINGTSDSVRGAIIMAELVSCVKRTFARVLVIVVALGYGIVKPRLGRDDRKIAAVALFHFLFSAVESSIRSLRPRFEQSKNEFYASVPLAFTDAIICWWIFSALIGTIKGLRLRRNIVKLSLYRHFTNTLVFAVLASLGFMVWSVTQHKFALCITAWRELWIDTAFWHLLFSVLLFVIMVLWRPSKNNQRYAFSPLLDVDELEGEDGADDELVMDNLADGIKSRSVGGGPTQEERQAAQEAKERRQGEDDLRWVEENIPTSVVDAALPSLLDSEEEILTTKYHMSKME